MQEKTAGPAAMIRAERSRAIRSIFDTANAVAKNPLGYLEELATSKGKKIVGCLALHVPEEMLHASGLHPAVLPDFDEPITIGGEHLQNFFCGYARRAVDVAIKKKLDFLDGLVMHDCCHAIRATQGIVERNCPQITWQECLWFPPHLEKKETKTFMSKELGDFKNRIERHTGHPLTDAALAQSIHLFNRHRRLLRRLYATRRAKPGLFSSQDMVHIMVAGMLMPKEEHCELVERLIAEAEAMPAPANGAVKLVLSGSLCEPPDSEVLEALDRLGVVVVDDDLWTGSRYFATDVAEGGDPLEALANAYINMVPVCPTRYRADRDLGAYVREMVQQSGADGVIFLIVKFCEPHYYVYTPARKTLQAAGVPQILIETGSEMKGEGQMVTRLEAFIEAIRGT